MIIDERTIEIGEKIISQMSDEQAAEIARREHVGDINGRDDLIEYLHEDYSAVMDLLRRCGISEITASDWCEECEQENDMTASPPEWIFVCPNCGNEIYRL